VIVTSASLGNPEITILAAAAAGAGFDALSLWPAETYGRARAEGWTDAGLRSLVADHGLTVHDVDAAVVWAGPGDPGPPYIAEAPEREVLAAAEALGAPVVNLLVAAHPETGEDAITEAIAAFTERARVRGVQEVHLEFTPRSAVPDLTTATRVVAAVGDRAVRVVFDTWHHHRTGHGVAGITPESASLVGTIQVSDAPPDPAGADRLLPGDGVVDLAGEIAALRAGGCRVPLTAEVISAPLAAAHPPDELARRLAAALRPLDAGGPTRGVP
jgi:sugar phosphate isomerase/epimerase